MWAMKFQTPFIHVFKQGDAAKRPLLLLHGTGADENNLLDLAATVAPDRTILSPRGRVLENGMPRFFRRLAEGVFDEADVIFRANELSEFVLGARAHYKIASPIALGFSNGANIAAAMLFLRPEILAGAVLLRAMAPLTALPNINLNNAPVMLISGSQDTMIPMASANRLAAALAESHANFTRETIAAGHGLTQSDVTHMAQFFKDNA